MKQIFSLLLVLTTGLLAYSAPRNTEPGAAAKAFETAYGRNKNAAWACTAQGCEATFEHKGQTITAVYSHSGQLRWYKKHIASTQLPAMLQLKLKNRFAKYWIADVQEKSGKGGASYLLTLENGYKKLVLTATGGTWQLVQSINKA